MKKGQKETKTPVGLKHPLIAGFGAAFIVLALALAAFFIAAAYAPQQQLTILYASLIPLHIGEFIALIFLYVIYVIAKRDQEKYKGALLGIFLAALALAFVLLFLEGIFWHEGFKVPKTAGARPLDWYLIAGIIRA